MKEVVGQGRDVGNGVGLCRGSALGHAEKCKAIHRRDAESAEGKRIAHGFTRMNTDQEKLLSET